MRLGSDSGDVLELSIVGYQFPEAEDPRKRYSWHMVEGRARTAAETWDFRWQALTCDESGRLVSWLREVADGAAQGCSTPAAGPGRTWFTEPNLAFVVETYKEDMVVLRVELDLEFRAPSDQADHRAGDPTVLKISTSPEQLLTAAAELESDVSLYPDGLANSG